MSETNFLNPGLETQVNPPAKVKRVKKKAQKKIAKDPAKTARDAASGDIMGAEEKSDKSIFKFRANLNVNPAMPKPKKKIEKKAPDNKQAEAGNIYRKIALSFVALTVILAAAVFYFGFSKVTLVIIPVQEKITDGLSLTVIDQISSPEISQGEIQGLVRQSPGELERTFNAGGKEVLGEEVSGKVTIINNYMKNQPLVATTRLLAQGNKLFRLRNTVNVPAGGQVEAEVYADEPEASMAIGPSRFTIPGLWAGIQDKIYAESRQPMQYSEKVKYVIKQSDIDNAVSELKKDLLAAAKKDIAAAYPEYDQLILQIDNNSINTETQGKVGEEKEKFTVKMKTMVTVVAFKSQDIYAQAKSKLAAALADDKEILELVRPEMVYNLGDYDLKQARAVINTGFAARITLKNSAGIIKKNNLTGLNAEQVKTYLRGLPEVAGYEIKFFPSFVRKMPKLVDRIEIVIKK